VLAFVTEDLVNLSPNAWNATLYYDDGKLNARVSAAYRDDYFQQVPAANGGTGRHRGHRQDRDHCRSTPRPPTP
jgi:hypothetical protein